MYRIIGRLHRTEQHTRTKISMVCITGLLLSLRVEMNTDDSYIIYLLEMKDCFESVDGANEVLLEAANDESGVVY